MVEVSVTTSLPWHQRVGNQRDWVWRGWQTRYTYLRAVNRDRKPPLLLLHGFGASIGHWRQNLEVLSQSHTVYALDMLGFGASEKAAANYGAALWVEQIYDFWQTFIRQPVVLIGNSIGSLICLAVAQAHPEMVSGIAMLSLPDPSVREDMMPKFLLPAIATIEGLFTSPFLLKALFRIVRRPQVVRPWARIAYANPEAVTDELVDILVGPAQDRGSAQAFSAILKAMTNAKFGPKVKDVLPTLQIPLLLIWGRQDRMIPYSQAQQFIRYNPQLQFIEIDQAGHCPHDEAPDEVNQILLNWIKGWGEPSSDPVTLSTLSSPS